MSKILLVDDDETSRILLSSALKRAGHDVSGCINGRAALAACGERRFDIVVTDIHMPEMDGLELIRALRRNHSPIRILAISGGASNGYNYLDAANKIGADRILPKPLNIGNFVHVVDELANHGGVGAAASH
jgi:PleD family two-component response regulator